MTLRKQAINHFIKAILEPHGADTQRPIEYFQEKLKLKTLENGELLISPGETNFELYFVHQGLMRIYTEDADGNYFNQTFIREGQIYADLTSFWKKKPISFSAQTLETSHILYCDYSEFDALIRSDIEFSRIMMGELEQYKIRHEVRELLLQTHTVEDYIKRMRKDFPYMESRIAQHHVASYFGVSEVSLSRIKKKLEKQ